MATDQGDVDQHMQRSSGKEEIPTKRLDFCRYCQRSATDEEKERCNSQQPKESSKSDSTRRVYRGKQSSQEQFKTDKENFIEDLAKKAKDAPAQGNMK